MDSIHVLKVLTFLFWKHPVLHKSCKKMVLKNSVHSFQRPHVNIWPHLIYYLSLPTSVYYYFPKGFEDRFHTWCLFTPEYLRRYFLNLGTFSCMRIVQLDPQDIHSDSARLHGALAEERLSQERTDWSNWAQPVIGIRHTALEARGSFSLRGPPHSHMLSHLQMQQWLLVS